MSNDPHSCAEAEAREAGSEERRHRPNDRILARGRVLRIRCQTPSCATLVEFEVGNCSDAVLGQRALEEKRKGVLCRECRRACEEEQRLARPGPDPALSFD